MADWCIRTGMPDDVLLLADIERASDTLFPPGRLPPGDATYPQDVLSAACAAGLLFVAERSGSIAGFAFCGAADGRLHIGGLAVHPEVARRGIGTALLQRVIAEARARGAAGVSLTTFADLPWNAPFYARYGFQVVADRALTPFLADTLADERAGGMQQRVAMVLPLRHQGPARLRAIQADITRLAVDAIVNAANSALSDGTGVNGAIQSAAGPELRKACASIGGCPVGEVRLTPGFRLPARYVVHAVGPIWRGGGRGEPELLAACYRSAIAVAAEQGCRSIAFPAISTGVYGYPVAEAAQVAVAAVRGALPAGDLEEIIFCCFSAEDLAIYAALLSDRPS
jgi:O-acetyl-ADP-ribose deacetylase (regulator of RNase III)/GNAT superfamily N-acetyltransferase